MNFRSFCRLRSSLAVLFLAVVAAEAEMPLPNPNLAGASPEARTAIEAARKQVEDTKSADPATRADAFGKLGMIYLAERLLDAAEPCFANAQELQVDQMRWSYFLAVVQQKKGDLQAAAANLRRALRVREGNLPAALRLGFVLIETRDFTEAEALFRAALTNELGAPAGHAGLGKIALALGDPRRAIQELEDALAKQPQANALHLPLAQAYQAVGDTVAAQKHRTLAGSQEVLWPDPLLAQLDPLSKTPNPRVATKDPKVDALLRRVESTPNDPETRRQLAAALVQAGDLEAAQAQLEELVRRTPADARGWLELGSIKADRQRNVQAGIADVRKATELDPKLREAHQRLAQMLTSAGKFAEAVPLLRKAIDLDPSLTVARLQLTRTLLALEKFDEAQQTIDQLLQREPGNFEALLMRGRVLASSNQPDAARRDFERVASTGSATPNQRAEAHYNLGLIQHASNQAAAAKAEYEKALGLDPRHFASMAKLANLEAAGGDVSSAVDRYQRLVEANPDNAENRYRLAALLTRAGDQRGALAQYEILHASNPTAPEFAVSSAMLLAELGEGAKAIERLRKVLASLEDPELKQRILVAIAYAHTKMNQHNEALSQLKQAMTLGEVAEIRLELARSLARLDRLGEAIGEYDRYLKSRAQDELAHFERAMALVLASRFAEARDRLVEVTKTSSNITLTHLLARIYASAPDAKVRNGERAVQIASTVFEKERNPIHGETLALALAAAGRFPDALVLQRRLLAEAEAAKFDPRFIERVKKNLALFEKNQVGVNEW